jgi:inhibitor of cysteine peptidase
MRRAALALGVAAILVALAACGSDAETSNTGGTTVSDEAVVVTRSGTVTLQVGQELVVTLESNPTTGYEWLVDTAPDSAVLQSNGAPSYEPTPVASDVVGSGGTTSLRFTATGAGTTQVVLRYKQSFEENSPDDQLVTVDVTVA